MSDQPRGSRGNELACRGGFVRADLKAYLDKELPAYRRWFVGRHVAKCPACSEEMAWLQRLGTSMRTLEDAYPRPELRARILSTLPPMEGASTQPWQSRTARQAPGIRYAWGVALCMLALTAAFAAVRSRSVAVKDEPLNIRMPGIATVGVPAKQADNREPTADSGTHSQALRVGPPDPTSRLANELTNKQLEQERASAAKRLPDEWSKAIKAVRSTGSQERGGYVQVGVEVNDTVAVTSALTAWVNKMHGSIKQARASEKTQQVTTLGITIRLEASAALYKELSASGKIVGITTAGSSAVSGYKANPGVPTVQSEHGAPLTQPEGNPAARSAGVSPDPAAGAKASGGATVLVVVQLAAAAPALN